MTTVVLCGSTRFEKQFKQANYELSKMGYVVLSLSSGPSDREPGVELDPVEKIIFDLTYFEKIRMADAVLVIDGVPTFDVGASHDPYVGFSTAREILWAAMQDRPMISLLSASGWGNIRQIIDERYNTDMFVGHTWLLEHARHVLRVEAGKAVATDLINDTAKSTLQAGLSLIACLRNTDSADDIATLVLEHAGLDPFDGDDTATWLNEIDKLTAIKARSTASITTDYGDGHVHKIEAHLPFGVQPAPPEYLEPMITTERRRVVGSVIMIQACANMLTQRRPKLGRAEVIDKLDMAAKTMVDSFGLTIAELDEAMHTNQD